MSILDALGAINPFKKKEEFSFPPIDSGPGHDLSPHNFEQNQGMSHEMPSLHQDPHYGPGMESQSALDDHRMTMPLGDNIRQQRMSSMHGEEEEYHEQKSMPNPLHKELELISSKLDYLKASLDAVNQRLVNLEHMTRQEMEGKKW